MELLQSYWSWLAVAVVVYMIGEGTKRLSTIWVPDSVPESKWPLWYRVWHVTLPIHPVTGAALFGFVPLRPFRCLGCGRRFWALEAGGGGAGGR